MPLYNASKDWFMFGIYAANEFRSKDANRIGTVRPVSSAPVESVNAAMAIAMIITIGKASRGRGGKIRPRSLPRSHLTLRNNFCLHSEGQATFRTSYWNVSWAGPMGWDQGVALMYQRVFSIPLFKYSFKTSPLECNPILDLVNKSNNIMDRAVSFVILFCS